MISITMKQLRWLLLIQMLREHLLPVLLDLSHVVDSLSAIKYAKVKIST